MYTTSKTRVVPALALAIAAMVGIALIAPAMASDDDAGRVSRDRSHSTAVTTASEATLDSAEVIANLQARGYHDFREVERDHDGKYEVKARDASGRRVELHVDASSGDILRAERDD